MELKLMFDTQIKPLIESLGMYLDDEPIFDHEYNMISFRLMLKGKWIHTVNIWVETCPNCGGVHTMYETYDPEQSEESDPDPKFETTKLNELIAYLRG